MFLKLTPQVHVDVIIINMALFIRPYSVFRVCSVRTAYAILYLKHLLFIFKDCMCSLEVT